MNRFNACHEEAKVTQIREELETTKQTKSSLPAERCEQLQIELIALMTPFLQARTKPHVH